MQKEKRAVGHIKKLDGDKYLLRLSCGFDEFGKRVQPSKVVHCTSDTEAEKALIEFYSQKDKLSGSREAPKTLKQLYDEWMEYHVRRNCAEQTRIFYFDIWNGHVADKGRAKLDAVTPKTIYKILDPIEKARTKNAVFKMLKSMFNKAVIWGYMDSNPCNRVETPKYQAGEKKPLSADEIKLVMRSIDSEDIKYQAIFYFAVLCGLRRQEILGLKWEDINFEKDCFYIRRAAEEVRGEGTLTKNPKTEKSMRTLFLPVPLKNVLLKHKEAQKQQKYIMGDKWHGDDWVFTQQDGKIMSLQTPSHWWKKFSEKIGITETTFHGLRHTAASYMIKNNVPITTVSGVLGHANTATTLNIYSHMLEDTKKEAINALADVFTTSENE